VEKELIIRSASGEVEIALLEEGNLVELHSQKKDTSFVVGDIFLGRIKKLNHTVNAAFVDIGHEKDAFLHYSDLGAKLKSVLDYTDGCVSGKISTAKLDNFTIPADIIKNDKIDTVLDKRATLLVQMFKEPISTKGPRLTTEITLPGRYMVLIPFSEGITVSKKIEDTKERTRLQVLTESIKPKNFSVILRTAAEGKKVADLHEEMKNLMAKWDQIHDQLLDAEAPVKLLSEIDKTGSIIRDLINESYTKIVVDDKELYHSIKAYLESFLPTHTKILNFYNGKKNIFDEYSVTYQIKSSFGRTSSMPSGAYIVIDNTEAMYVIDVNSGHRVSGSSQEESILRINLEAAQEIARQLRLRDIGGLIVIDFIDMRNVEHKRILMEKMKDFMAADRAQHTILPLSKFALMQITRERVRPALEINTSEVCPTCNGSGKINASILVTDEIERDLEFIMRSKPDTAIQLHVHPFLGAFLKKDFWKQQRNWYSKYSRWIKIVTEQDLPVTTYKFYDKQGDEIRFS